MHLFYFIFIFVLFWGSFLNSCGCSTVKSKTPPQETIFYPLTGTEHESQPSSTTRDRELVSVLEVRIEPGDLNPRPLTSQSVTLPTLSRAGICVSYRPIILFPYLVKEYNIMFMIPWKPYELQWAHISCYSCRFMYYIPM